VIVEWKTRKREMWGDWGDHHAKLGLKIILSASQWTTPDTASPTTYLPCNLTDTSCFQYTQASYSPNFACLLVSSTSFSSSFSISLLLVHKSTIIAEHQVKSSLSISPYDDHELTASTAYSEYSIHQVQDPPKIVCLPYIRTMGSWPRISASASGVSPYTIDCHLLALHVRSKVQSHGHIPMISS